MEDLIGIDVFINDDDNGADSREGQVATFSGSNADWQIPSVLGNSAPRQRKRREGFRTQSGGRRDGRASRRGSGLDGGRVRRDARRVLRNGFEDVSTRPARPIRRACWSARARRPPRTIRTVCSTTARPITGGSMRSTRPPTTRSSRARSGASRPSPIAYPITSVTATASSSDAGMGPAEDDRRLRAQRRRPALHRADADVDERPARADLDPVRVRQGLQAARDVGVELQPVDRAVHRLRGQGRHDRVLHRRRRPGRRWKACRSSPRRPACRPTPPTRPSISAASWPSSSS